MNRDESLEDIMAELNSQGGDDEFSPDMHQQRTRNNTIISNFLGEGERENAVVIAPRYYNELLTWALHRYLEAEGWKVIHVLGYRYSEPVYADVNTDYDQYENLPIEACLLVEKGNSRFTITIYPVETSSVAAIKVEGLAPKKEEIHQFARGVKSISEKQNFYRGKKLKFDGRIRFLHLPSKLWESIILPPDLKADVQANTIDFLANQGRLARYGIPSKRGILLVGEPGTGKTLVCKALMAQSTGVTGIIANAEALICMGYISNLYELAQDLSPCIVFIEDIDLIADERRRWVPLLSLLSELDGVEEHEQIITIATTNHLEIIDKALSQRPSRFDRVIELPRPAIEYRREFISSLSGKIPMDEGTQRYLVDRTEGFTLAQIQEIVYTMVIEYSQNNHDDPEQFSFSEEEVTSAISRINGRNGHRLGFNTPANHGYARTMREN
jgi:cell division protease FtsH